MYMHIYNCTSLNFHLLIVIFKNYIKQTIKKLENLKNIKTFFIYFLNFEYVYILLIIIDNILK